MITIVLLIWGVIGFVTLVVMAMDPDTFFNKLPNDKQLTFILFLCGPTGWVLLIFLLIAMAALEIYKKLGE